MKGGTGGAVVSEGSRLDPFCKGEIIPGDDGRRAAIVVLHYDNYEGDTRRCLNSLRGIKRPNTQVIVVDNASLDDAGPRIAQDFPEVRVLLNDSNLGFAGGNNRGIRVALTIGAEYIILLNNDTTVVDPQFVSRLVAVASSDRRVGLVGPRVMNGFTDREQNTVLTPLIRRLRHRITYRDTRHVRQRDSSSWYVPAISCVCVLIPASVINDIGALDDAFFMYGEDNDLSYRVNASGRDIVLLDNIAIEHFQKSVQDKSLWALRHQMHYVNKIYLMRKHRCSKTYIASQLPIFSVRALLHTIRRLPRVRLLSELRAWWMITRGMIREMRRHDAPNGPLVSPHVKHGTRDKEPRPMTG